MSAFLNVILFERGFRTSQIAIGDNLMRHRILELIFHINKSFVVKRTGTPMELYRYSVQLSDYIWRQITEKTDSFRNYYSAEDRENVLAYFEQRFRLLTNDEEGFGREYVRESLDESVGGRGVLKQKRVHRKYLVRRL